MGLISFHGKKKIKNFFIARMKKHIEMDELVQGLTWENGKGCAIGCVLNEYNHKAYESELGLPEWLARLEDRIFEGLTPKDAKGFPLEFLKAVPIGVDVSIVEPKFKLWLLENELYYDQTAWPSVKQAVDTIKKLLESQIEGNMPSDTDWSEARSAAESAAESAAWSARSEARSAAESAAWSARSEAWSTAESAESAAESAAESEAESARSAAWSTAWSAAYKRMSVELLRLLKEVAHA